MFREALSLRVLVVFETKRAIERPFTFSRSSRFVFFCSFRSERAGQLASFGGVDDDDDDDDREKAPSDSALRVFSFGGDERRVFHSFQIRTHVSTRRWFFHPSLMQFTNAQSIFSLSFALFSLLTRNTQTKPTKVPNPRGERRGRRRRQRKIRQQQSRMGISHER